MLKDILKHEIMTVIQIEIEYMCIFNSLIEEAVICYNPFKGEFKVTHWRLTL